MPVSIQEDIRKNLTNLDFHNADVFDYLDHLLNGMIVATGMNQYGGLAETKLGDIVMEVNSTQRERALTPLTRGYTLVQTSTIECEDVELVGSAV